MTKQPTNKHRVGDNPSPPKQNTRDPTEPTAAFLRHARKFREHWDLIEGREDLRNAMRIRERSK